MNQKSKWVVVAAFILFAYFLAQAARPAKSHEWYAPACCSERDCRPALAGEVKATTEGYLHIKSNTLLKWGDSRLRPSQDAETHICVTSNSAVVFCIYYATGG